MSVALPGASLVALAGAPPNGPLPEQNLVEWLFSSPFGPGGSGVSFGSTLASPGRHLDGPVAPTKPIFVDARTGAQLSHQRLYADTLRYASGLRHLLGLLPAPVPGSPANTSPIVSPVVLMHSPNCLPFVPIMLGIHAAQLCVNMANPALTTTEIAKIIVKCRPAAIFTANLSVIQAAVAEIGDETLTYRYKSGGRVFLIDPHADDYGLAPPARPPVANAAGWRVASHTTVRGSQPFKIAPMRGDENVRRVACMLNSSGTGGNSKMVMQPHSALIWSVVGLWHGNRFGSDERWLGFAPFFHVFGLSTILLHSIAIGATVMVMNQFDVKQMLEIIPRQRITHLHMAPPVGVILAKSPLVDGVDFSTCKDATSGGAPLGPDVIQAVYDRLGMTIRMGYGTSEAASICSTMGKDWPEIKKSLGTTGTPHIGVQLRIASIDGKDRTLQVGEEGEILLKSASNMLGYYADPQTTAETLRADGWQHTGDVGKLVNGQLYITDRLKDVFKVKGFQVSPAELEDVLCGMPDLVDAGCTSVYSTEDASEYPRAYVVPKDPALVALLEHGPASATAELVALADRIKKHTEARLIKYKHLAGGLVFIPKIPKSPTGKILRRELKDQVGVEVLLYPTNAQRRAARESKL